MVYCLFLPTASSVSCRSRLRLRRALLSSIALYLYPLCAAYRSKLLNGTSSHFSSTVYSLIYKRRAFSLRVPMDRSQSLSSVSPLPGHVPPLEALTSLFGVYGMAFTCLVFSCFSLVPIWLITLVATGLHHFSRRRRRHQQRLVCLSFDSFACLCAVIIG